MDFEEYKNTELKFERTGYSFEERVGEPDELSSVIGKVVIQFSKLEDELCRAITKMIQTDDSIGKILTSELSYKKKIDLFASLYNYLKNDYNFNVGKFGDAYFKEIIKMCFKCEELRNQVIHSTIVSNYETEGRIYRLKVTAKSKNGLNEIKEEIDVPYLFDIADYICYVTYLINELFLVDRLK